MPKYCKNVKTLVKQKNALANHDASIRVLTDRQRLVLHSKIMQLSIVEGLAWVNGQLGKGNEISESLYNQEWGAINNSIDIKIMEIASRGIFMQHLERIQNLELVVKLSWRNYHKIAAQDPYKSQRILDSIAAMQPLLSKYYEATTHIVEEEAPQVILALEKRGIKTPEEIIKVFQQKDMEKIAKTAKH